MKNNRMIPMKPSNIVYSITVSLVTLFLVSCTPPSDQSTEAEPTPTGPVTCTVVASSHQNNAEWSTPRFAVDGEMATRWSSNFSDDEWIRFSFADTIELSGLILHWEAAYGAAYEIQTSIDGKTWQTVYQEQNGDGGTDEIRFDQHSLRYVRINLIKRGTTYGYSLLEVQFLKNGNPLEVAVEPAEDDLSLQQYYEIATKRMPGCYPRWLSSRQAFWTVLGVPADDKESIFCEDGTLEHHKRGYTVMPLLYAGGSLITRDDATVTQSLTDGTLPLPHVHWDHPHANMHITAFAYGNPGESSAHLRYTVTNPTDQPQSCRLYLLIRPFQLYPPWQGEGEGENEEEGKGLGGLTHIDSIRRTNNQLIINSKYTTHLLTPPTDWGTTAGVPDLTPPFRDKLIDDLRTGSIPTGKNVDDPEGFASAVLEYAMELPPGSEQHVQLALPLHAPHSSIDDALISHPSQQFEAMNKELEQSWRKRLDKVQLSIPEAGYTDTLIANMGYTFITLDGPALQPGSWCYDKAWIRDGTIAAVALLRLGYIKQARDFINWYAEHQYDTGEIPCVIDNKAKNPYWEGISEYDSQGQFVCGVLQYYLITRDNAFLTQQFPRVVKALQYAESLRTRTTAEDYANNPDFVNCRGLISKSYANHNYSDNLWTLRGWRDGAQMAAILNRPELVEWMNREHDALSQSIYNSISNAMITHSIDYIPEYPEGKHFWPASIAMGVASCDAAYAMPTQALARTMDMTYERLQNWLKPNTDYRFTPEEMPIAEAFLYLGQKQRALDFMRFMLDHQKPAGWKQWPEVVNSDERKPTIFGDMPHTWVSAQYAIALCALIAYERDQQLIVGAGISADWVDDGLYFKNLHTHFGTLTLRMKRIDDNNIRVHLSGTAKPPKGLVLHSPIDQPIHTVTINDSTSPAHNANKVRLQTLPADIILTYED